MTYDKDMRLLFAARLTEVVRLRGVTLTEIAKKMGLVPQAVQQWTHGKCMPRGERLYMLAQILEVEPNIFFQEKSLNSDQIATQYESTDKRYLYIENFLFSNKPAPIKMLAVERHSLGNILGQSESADLRVIAVTDDSMSPTLKNGDAVIMNIKINEMDGDGLYCFTLKNSFYIKRLQRVPEGILVISDNKMYQNFVVAEDSPDKIQINGKIMVLVEFCNVN